jgi:SAM-dependent methyltransferase
MNEIDWNTFYQGSEAPWESGRPSTELARVIAEEKIQPCRAVELGCGTGTNAVWLAQRGFEVTAVDISQLAIEKARRRATSAGVEVRFEAWDVLGPPELNGPFAFFFDRGCYHVVRDCDLMAYLRTLQLITAPDSLGLVLAGNAREAHAEGPPVVTSEQMRTELGKVFEIVRLREFYFDQTEGGVRYLAWSCLLRRQGSGRRLQADERESGLDKPRRHSANAARFVRYRKG